ncbi:MAG: DUF1631 domain-containing protein [Xanthomonadaceae bacterium]|nr:DUF1631 domain-containing protein [Xanthomonadaceae bacterium]
MTFRSPAGFHSEFKHPHGPLLDALQKRVLDSVVPAFESSLSELDDYLFDRSQNGEETLGLMALRDMRQVRGELSKGFRQRIADRFRELRQHRLHADGGTADTDTDSGLSLLSDQDLEQQLAVDQLASSALRNHASAYELATQRFCAVVGQAQLEANANPLSPAFLAAALGQVMGQREIEAELRIVAFKFFERELAGALGELYEHCNNLMVSAGVLPELRSTAKSQPAAAKAPNRHAAPAEATQPYETEQVPTRPQAAAAWDTAPPQASAVDQALFASMLGQLQHWRAANNVAPHQAHGTSGQSLSTGDLLSILTLMQRDAEPVPAVAGHAGSAQSFAGLLRQQMSQSARKLGVASDNLTLDGLDGDAVDLVALLFDVLLDGPQYDNRIRQMIGRMLVPFVKVAVKDRRMFMYKEHPARRLLNTVAEACEGNRGEAPQEQELLDHVDHTIDRLVAEFNEDVAIFEALEQDLRVYMAQHRKRFELAEKRTTEAHRGRERLEQARTEVNADLEKHRDGRELPSVIDEFVATHAQHHLTQIVLRDGHGSPRYREALQGLDAFLQAVVSAMQGTVLPLPEAELLAILASAGCVGEDGQAALEALSDVVARLSIGQAAKTSDERIPAPIVLAEPPPPPTPQLEVVGGVDAVPCDDSLLARMGRLEVGNWLQLQGADGQFAPAKVSWISPISARLLLVNRRGIRVLVASVRELAVMSALGKIKLREGDAAFDDAMHQVADRLQGVKLA